MKLKTFFGFLKEGFALAIKSLDIFLISLPLSLFYFLNFFLNNSMPSIISLLNYPLVLLQIGMSLSMPLFLQNKQRTGKSNYKEVFMVTLRNTKKIILPGILFFVIFIAAFIALVVASFALGPLSQTQMQEFIENSFIWWQISFLLISILFLIFEFTAYYFSLENKGLFESMKRSISTAFKNLPYLFYLAVINVLAFVVAVFVPKESNIGQFTISVLSFFLSFILTSTTLIYYQKVVKKMS